MDEFAGYIDRWCLTRDAAVVADDRAMAVTSNGQAATLLLTGGAGDAATAPRALRHFDGHGAVRMLRQDRSAVLLERPAPASPLTALVSQGRDDEATAVVADLMLQLHRGRRPPAGWPKIEDQSEAFARRRAHGVHRRLPARLVDRGEAIFRHLVNSQGKRFLLHGDLRHDTVLYDNDRGWLAVEPRGVIAESALEAAAFLRSPMQFYPFAAEPAFMARRVAILAERLSLDRSRIIGWFVVDTLLTVCRQIEAGFPEDAVARGARLAEAGLALEGAP